MNILFINSISASKFGGGEKWMIKAAKGLADVGHRTIIASKRRARIVEEARRVGVETCMFNIRGDFSPINTFRIARFLKQENIDVLVCNLNKDVRVGGLAAKLAKHPVVIARHGIQLCAKKWKHKVTLLNLTDGIVTNTETIRSNYMDYGWFPPDFIHVVYNGITDKSHVVAHDFSKDYPNKKIIFAAGRLSDQKGFTYLIEAAARLNQKHDDLVFLIAGEGRESSALKRLIRERQLENFHLMGFVPDIDPFLKGCDLFVLSSLFEGMPNVVMEAMAVGKAVIATDVNGVRELMGENKSGLIVPSRDARALALAIETVIDNTDRMEQMGKAGQEIVQQRFTIPVMIRALENYFIQMIAKHTTNE